MLRFDILRFPIAWSFAVSSLHCVGYLYLAGCDLTRGSGVEAPC